MSVKTDMMEQIESIRKFLDRAYVDIKDSDYSQAYTNVGECYNKLEKLYSLLENEI